MSFFNLLHWCCRLALGGVFIYAAYEKILDPQSFAQSIDNYRLFPQALIGPLAIALPWLEMICGLMVILGLWLKPAGFILAMMLIGFIAAVSFNLYRGLDFECGCFGSGGGRAAGWELVWQDSLLLLAAFFILLRRRKPRGGLTFN